MRESGQNAVLKINQIDLIDELADDFIGIYDRETITNIIKGLEENIVYHLKRATKEKSVLIKLFFGLQITSRIVDEQEVSLNGTHYIRSERYSVRSKISRYFNRVIMNEMKH